MKRSPQVYRVIRAGVQARPDTHFCDIAEPPHLWGRSRGVLCAPADVDTPHGLAASRAIHTCVRTRTHTYLPLLVNLRKSEFCFLYTLPELGWQTKVDINQEAAATNALRRAPSPRALHSPAVLVPPLPSECCSLPTAAAAVWGRPGPHRAPQHRPARPSGGQWPPRGQWKGRYPCRKGEGGLLWGFFSVPSETLLLLQFKLINRRLALGQPLCETSELWLCFPEPHRNNSNRISVSV